MKYEQVKLKDVIFFNPKETIKKNQLTKKIPMDALIPFTRKVRYYEVKEFSSGTKFRNNDILMARITPCLENGKTAYVDILNEDEVAFGSTEYFVLRANENYILPKYLYYLSISDGLRNIVIKSMTGTSGRQRAQKEAVLDFEIELPSISIQKKVLSILDSIDSKIELNNQIISNLEELASTLFKRWFVDFEFPDENGNPYKSSGGKMVDSELGEIPNDFNVQALHESIEVKYGKDHKKLDDGEFPVYGSGGLMRFAESYLFSGESVLIPRKGSLNNIMYVNESFWTVDTMFFTKMKKKNIAKFIYLLLKKVDLASMNVGSAVPSMTTAILNSMPIIMPFDSILEHFEKIILPVFMLKNNYEIENKTLADLRDSLLSKLLSGEIELPEDEEV
ncbi:TPA: restriction endonuclease subunit S [Enterococcus faecium]